LYPGAGFYGIREILLAYARLPSFFRLPVAVQHGWCRFATAFEADETPPEIWVWSQRSASEFEAFYPKKKIRIIGSYYYYLMELLKNELPPAERRGSICIPPHSSSLVSNEYSVEDFARKLYELGDEYKPITIMLYYLDMKSNTIAGYEKFGFKVVTNGSLYEADFLKKFVLNVYDKQHCIYSDMGSGILFAADMGLTLIHIDIDNSLVNKGSKYHTDKMILQVKTFDENFIQSLDKSQIALELGKSYLLSPSELRRVIFSNYFTWLFTKRLAGYVLTGVINIRIKVRTLMKRMFDSCA